MKLCVIIPVYNTEAYLRRCLDSLVDQTVSADEIILVDDGSTDKSLDVCDEYSSKYPYIHVVRKGHDGLVATRKAGINATDSEYILYIDSDDYVEPGLVERIYDIIDEYHPDMISSAFIKDFGGLSTLRDEYLCEGCYKKEDIDHAMNRVVNGEPFFTPLINQNLASKVVKRSILYPIQMAVDDEIEDGEDVAVVIPLLGLVESLYINSTPFYHYVARDSSMSWKKRDVTDYERLITLTKNMVIAYDKAGLNEDYRKYLLYQTYQNLLDDLDAVPIEYFENREIFPFWEQIKKGDRVIVYGKGIFSKSLVDVFRETGFCDIVGVVDSKDAKDSISELEPNMYDEIVVAIANSSVVNEVKRGILSMGVPEDRISCIDKSHLKVEELPYELKHVFR